MYPIESVREVEIKALHCSDEIASETERREIVSTAEELDPIVVMIVLDLVADLLMLIVVMTVIMIVLDLVVDLLLPILIEEVLVSTMMDDKDTMIVDPAVVEATMTVDKGVEAEAMTIAEIVVAAIMIVETTVMEDVETKMLDVTTTKE